MTVDHTGQQRETARVEQKATLFDCKALQDDGTFEGYASTFGNVDNGGDLIEPGAFDKTLREMKKTGRLPKLLWQHDYRKPIGVITDIRKDDKGIIIKGKLSRGTTLGAEAYELLKDGAMDGLSIGYRATDFDYDSKKGIRLLKEILLHEVSLVTFPMNDLGRVSAVKSDLPHTEREFEQFLRDAGFSRKMALGITTSGFKAAQSAESSQRDAGLEALNETLSKLAKGISQ